MAMSDEEYIEILRYFQEQLQTNAPDIFEHLAEFSDFPQSPRLMLSKYIGLAIEMLKEQSVSSYPRVLNLLNEYIRTENGAKIDEIQIVFTEEDSQLYGTKELNLSEMPDKSQLISELSEILEVIENESETDER